MQAKDSQTADAAPAPGRPRDPALEDRIFDAAIAEFAEHGWRGFTIEAIARASGVGKGAIYRRWDSRVDLLAATLERRWRAVGEIDTGTLRGDLTELARFVLALLMDTHGGVAINMQVDARQFADVRAVAMPFVARMMERLRLIASRAMERGELPGDTNTRLLTDMLVGAITNRVLSTPPDLERALMAQSDRFVSSLVDVIINGAGSGKQLYDSDD